jgi:hypothetical protein
MVSPNETNADIYVVRPDTKFVNDSDPNYFEFRYPDIFPFGRGGTHEKRRIKISRKALLAYMLNLSTRQFQEVDFVLPVYDMVTRQQVSTIGFVRSQIPSRKTNADGTVSSKAEAFGRVSLLDMKKVCEHKIACVKSASKGGTLPPPPQLWHFKVSVAWQPNFSTMSLSPPRTINIRSLLRWPIEPQFTQHTIPSGEPAFGSPFALTTLSRLKFCGMRLVPH